MGRSGVAAREGISSSGEDGDEHISLPELRYGRLQGLGVCPNGLDPIMTGTPTLRTVESWVYGRLNGLIFGKAGPGVESVGS